MIILPLTHLQNWYAWQTNPGQHNDLPPFAPHDIALLFTLAQSLCFFEGRLVDCAKVGLNDG